MFTGGESGENREVPISSLSLSLGREIFLAGCRSRFDDGLYLSEDCFPSSWVDLGFSAVLSALGSGLPSGSLMMGGGRYGFRDRVVG